MNDVIKFSTEDLKKRITETTQAQFGMMIPQEMFEQLVQDSITKFTDVEQNFQVQEIKDPNYTGNSWNHPTIKVLAERMTPFQVMVRNALMPIVQEMLTKYLADYREQIQAEITKKLEHPSFNTPLSKNVAGMMSVVQERILLQYMDGVAASLEQSIQYLNSRIGN